AVPLTDPTAAAESAGDSLRGIDMATQGMTRLERYHYLTQVVIPRPIAWVVSTSHDTSSAVPPRDCNLAPYAYFNIVASDPPAIVLGVNSEANERLCTDTLRNIRAQECFTISIPHVNLAEKVAATAAPLPYGASEA